MKKPKKPKKPPVWRVKPHEKNLNLRIVSSYNNKDVLVYLTDKHNPSPYELLLAKRIASALNRSGL